MALDPLRAGLDVSTIFDISSKVSITFEIEATIPEGAPDSIARTVTANTRTLKYSQFGVEEEC